MKQLALILFGIFCLSIAAVQEQKGKNEPRAHDIRGFFKARDFLELTEVDQGIYSTGLIDGFSGSVFFGASDERVAGLNSCTEGMDNKQVTAIITEYVKDHPETWHLPMNVEAYNALNKACPGGLRGANRKD